MNACFRSIINIIISAWLLGLPSASHAQPLFDKGWQALLKDNDTLALRLFGDAYLEAYRKDDTLGKAQSLLYMGICSYGVSYSKGAAYCYRAMEEYKKMEQRRPAKALEGRSRCLLLLATIESRLGNTQKSAALSYEALAGFRNRTDTTHSLGLIYANLGNINKKRGNRDSATYYYEQALAEQLRAGDVAYQPGS
ncbi:MAG: tetratricopeptide repeat protein, partial [Sphingobacteriales bacterium]